MSKTFLSVIVLTRNRALEVLNCLGELDAQSAPYDDVEIIVVDNASTDNTKQVVSEFVAKSDGKFSYVYEPRIGTSNTRNSGRRSALGSILAYIDDDEIPHPYWISRIREHFLLERSDSLAGRIEVKPDGILPEWFPDNLMWVLGKSRFGDHDRLLVPPEGPHTGNFALRAEVFDSVGGFDSRFAYYGEEVDFLYNVNERGYSTFYRNDVAVDHCISAARLTKSTLRKKAYLIGRGAGVFRNKRMTGTQRWVWMLRDFYQTALVAGAWSIGRRFDREFTFFLNLGCLLQTLSV